MVDVQHVCFWPGKCTKISFSNPNSNINALMPLVVLHDNVHRLK